MVERKRVVSKLLGELLIERRLINKSQLEKALQLQKEKGGQVGQALIALGFVREEDVVQAFTVQYGFPYLPLENYEISEEMIKLIPENVARHYNLVPIDKIGNLITLAMSDPLNEHASEDIAMITKCQVQIFVSTISDITKTIDKYYGKK